jgi:glycosyltransferase involved in cell wall biosynthesis
MRVLMLSKALVHGAYQRKCEELAALPGIELTLAVPHSWHEPRVGTQPLERRYTAGYQLEALPIAFNGRHHLHFYPTFGRLVARVRPDVLHADDEAFNLSTFLAFRAGVRYGARCCFFNWANNDRFYPPPFAMFERSVFRHAAHAIAGNQEAAALIRRHGYSGPLSVVPQFGVDEALFSPKAEGRTLNAEAPASDVRTHASNATVVRVRTFSVQRSAFRVGYLGRLVPEKGVLDLVDALARLPEGVRLLLVGDGVQRAAIVARAAELGVAGRVELRAGVSSTAVPAVLRELDALALPSRTTPNWKEQFGRVLIEAMSCGVPVVGSSSGEIPHVIGDAGLVFPEGDVVALAAALASLERDPALAAEFARRGRERVLAYYTQSAIARRYAAIYAAMLR